MLTRRALLKSAVAAGLFAPLYREVLAQTAKPMRLVLQGVGDRLQHHFDRAWRPDEARAGRLVVIGEQGLDRGALEAALAA